MNGQVWFCVKRLTEIESVQTQYIYTIIYYTSFKVIRTIAKNSDKTLGNSKQILKL